jgi:CRISPR-associated exonuclease Cas4
MGPIQVALLLAFLLILFLAFLLWRRAMVGRAGTGLPKGQIVYSDMGQWEETSPLYAPRYALAGKPDYLLRIDRQTIPVEVKPSRRAPEPYAADTLQLAAYCLLVEETTGVRPAYGLLRYRDQTFQIPFDERLRQTLLATLHDMRRDLHQRDVARSHTEPVRCRLCGQRAHCEQRLD